MKYRFKPGDVVYRNKNDGVYISGLTIEIVDTLDISRQRWYHYKIIRNALQYKTIRMDLIHINTAKDIERCFGKTPPTVFDVI